MIPPPDGLERFAYGQAEAHHAAPVSFFHRRCPPSAGCRGPVAFHLYCSSLPFPVWMDSSIAANLWKKHGCPRRFVMSITYLTNSDGSFCANFSAVDCISSYKQKNSPRRSTDSAYTPCESALGANTPPPPCSSLFVIVNAANSRSSFELLPRLLESHRVASTGIPVSSKRLSNASGILSPESL